MEEQLGQVGNPAIAVILHNYYYYYLLDHIAVMLYLKEKVPALTLHLPTKWQSNCDPCFHDNNESNIWKNPGRSANKLHRQFSNKLDENTLSHLQSVIMYLGAKCHMHNGFKERNTAVARDSKYLIAFTWSDDNSPKKESGTHDTWKKHLGTKTHIPIGSLLDIQRHVDTSKESRLQTSTCLDPNIKESETKDSLKLVTDSSDCSSDCGYSSGSAGSASLSDDTEGCSYGNQSTRKRTLSDTENDTTKKFKPQ